MMVLYRFGMLYRWCRKFEVKVEVEVEVLCRQGGQQSKLKLFFFYTQRYNKFIRTIRDDRCTKSDKVESQINLHFSYQKNRTTDQNLYIGNYWNAGVLNLFDMLITTISHVYYETAVGSFAGLCRSSGPADR
jgi:hypothetical protein